MFIFLFPFVDPEGLLAWRLVNRESLQLVTTFLLQLHDVAPYRLRKFALRRKINCLRANGGSMDNCINKGQRVREVYRRRCLRYKIYHAIYTCIMCYRHGLMVEELSLHVPHTCLNCEHKYYCSACKKKPTLLNRCLSCVVKEQYCASPWFKAERESCIASVSRPAAPRA